MADLFGPLLERCPQLIAGDVVDCAVSGGPDSMALLALAAAAGCRVTAIHVDHGIRDGSDREAALVAVVADRFGAAILRDAEKRPLAAATRRAMLLRFASVAADRLHRLSDPEF